MTRAFLLLMILAGPAVLAADLLVAAASDLAPMGSTIASGFEAARGHKVKFTYGSSGSLARQIENGAPYDVLLSAGEAYVRDLIPGGHVKAESLAVYGVGRIAVWSADGSVKVLADLVKPGVRHVSLANPQHAPYGLAAKQALERQGLWKDVQPRLVFGENVRQALQFAESRNADAVITSWTLLKGRGTLIPPDWHDPIRQAGAVVARSGQPEAAGDLLRFLTSERGQKILADGGLFPAEPPPPAAEAKPKRAAPGSAPPRKRPSAARRSSRR